MTTMADSLVNSAMRPLRLRVRPDLESRRHKYHGRAYWVVKEPVGLNYFRFHEEEYAILYMLDGNTSLQDIRDRFQAAYAPQRITIQDLQQFVGMLHRSGLVISHSSGQGRQLRRRGYEKKKKELLGKVANVFALRFRGIDPEKILNRLLPWFGWFFTTWALMLVIAFGLCALTLVLVNFQLFRTKLPTFEQFFAANNWMYLGLTMATVKVMHEFGHGLSCKKFGGECHEMGFMMLVFTPCLYCNVSDSWMLPNKWQRVFIGAAGMYVELILASIATFIWWYSEPGMLNFLALSVMFICSVSTVVFNGNPLLRFDGYYILMDILEIPNLRQKSSEVLKRSFQKTCLGLELQDNPFLPTKKQFWFACYTIAAVLYRWVVVFSIVFFLNQVLEPYGLQILGRLFAIMGFVGLIAQPVIGTVKFFRTPGRASKMKRANVLTSLTVAAAIIGLVCFVPLPYHVNCAVRIQPADAFAVRTMVPGQLVAINRRPGEFVNAGDPIFQLRNLRLEQERIKYEGDLKSARLNRQQAELDAVRETSNTSSLSLTEVAESAANQLYTQSVERLKQLDVTSKVSGVVIEPKLKETPKELIAAGQLPSWSGSPFEEKNADAYFADGELLCYIGDLDRMEAVIIIDQSDVWLVEDEGKRDDAKTSGENGSPNLESIDFSNVQVDIMLDAAQLKTLTGTIVEISNINLKETSASMASQTGGSLDTTMDSSGRLTPISTSFEARVQLQDSDVKLRAGYRGQAKIHLQWRSLGWRIWRYAVKTFKFDF